MRFFLGIILFLEFVFCFSVAGQPNAHIVSTPYGICNRDLATVDVLMSGEAPFGLQYKISYQKSTDYVIYTSELLYPDLNMTTQFQHLVGNNQDDKAVIQLLKVRDNGSGFPQAILQRAFESGRLPNQAPATPIDYNNLDKHWHEMKSAEKNK